MTFKANIDEAGRILYYSSSIGDDSFDGRSLEVPKSTPQAAIDAAALLLPPPELATPVRVKEGQGGVFIGDIELKDFVLFEGFQTAVVGIGSVGVSAADSISFNIQGIVNTAASSVGLLIDGNVSFGVFAQAVQGRGTNSKLIKITGSVDDIFIEAKQILANADGIICFYLDATSPTPIDINCDTCILDGDGCIFANWNAPNDTDLSALNISTVTSTGTNNDIFMIEGGRLSVQSQVLQADRVATVKTGGRLSVNCSVASGDFKVENTGVMFLRADLVIGDIVVDSGGLLQADILVHVGTITNNGIINGTINCVDFGDCIDVPAEEELLIAFSMSDQNPAGLDTPLQIEFGAAQGSGSDPVQIAADGTVTINEDREYMFRTTFQFGRTAAGGVSWLFLRATINGTQFGNSILVKLDNPNIDTPAQITGTADLVDGDVLRFEIIRDSQGNNSGGLLTETPTLAWNDSPSATIRINRGILVKP